MRQSCLLIKVLFLIPTILVNAQNTPISLAHEGVLWSENDSFFVIAPNWSRSYAFTTTAKDTVDLGTDGFPGQRIIVWTSSDTLVVPYVNSPNEQWLYVKVGSPNDTTVYRLRFNEQSAGFTEAYIKENRGKTTIHIPEVYELANVILYLSDCSRKTSNHPENTEYTRQVEEYFRPVINHRLIHLLNEKCGKEDYWDTYYNFRENSICFAFKEGLLTFETPYKRVIWDQNGSLGGQFRALLYLVQDFAEKSRFQEFYAAHREYYTRLEKRQSGLLPLSKMWKWLEQEFPARMDSYKVFFSPLIGGSHSTQQFYKGSPQAPTYRECIMFVNSPEEIDARHTEPKKIKEGLMSGIVFTEIDHNYVNSASNEFSAAIRSLIADKNFWATMDAQKNYRSEVSIFNEYMTHALFCLYSKENYTRKQADAIISRRINLMERRGFIKFKEFNATFLRLTEMRSVTIYQLYGQIIEEMKKVE